MRSHPGDDTRPPDTGRRRRAAGEDGVGVVGSVLGVTAFLGFVLVVVQVVLYAFTASVVQAAALDAATQAARDGTAAPVVTARERAEAVLGGLADEATVTGAVRPAADGVGGVLRVTVTVRPPSGLVRGLGLTAIERSAEARVEA